MDAIKIVGFEQQKKGGTTFRVPKFLIAPLSEETNKQAVALDAELQAYLSEYLKRPRVEAAAAAAKSEAPHEQPQPKADAMKNPHFDDMKDDKPWENAERQAAAEEEIPF